MNRTHSPESDRAPQRDLFAAEAPDEACVAAGELRQLLTEVFLHEHPAARLLVLNPLVPVALRSAWHLVTHTLLARRLAIAAPGVAGPRLEAGALHRVLARQWDQPALQQRWDRLVSGMTARQCALLVTQGRRLLRRTSLLH